MNRLAKYLARIGVFSMLALLLVACGPGGTGQGTIPTNTPPQPADTPISVPTLEPIMEPTIEPIVEPTSPVQNDVMLEEKAEVESVEVVIMESFPVQARAIVKGNHRDGCARIKEVIQSRDGNTFMLDVISWRNQDGMCTQALVPYEESVALDVTGLKAGTYTVNANGVTAQFTLSSDN